MPSQTLTCLPYRSALTVLGLTLLLADASAQTQVVKPPVAQYWMDVSTASVAGMVRGTPGQKSGAGDGSHFGATRGASPGRWLDLAVATQRKPNGTQAVQLIPPGQAMGASLTLQPVDTAVGKPAVNGLDAYDGPEQPKGRVLLYWGCGDTVRDGQPKVIDFNATGAPSFARFMTGRGVRQFGATAAPGNAVWPTAQYDQPSPKSASLVGQHTVTGDGLPTSLQFAVPAAQDIMPPLALTGTGGGNRATTIGWNSLSAARAYFVNAMGTVNSGADPELVIWSSSEVPEPGWGLMDYIGNSHLDKWLGEKVLLSTNQTRCAIPAGIFAKVDSATVQAIAYGQELHLTHPARPANAKVAWEQEWTAQIRVKSQSTMPLDQGGLAVKRQTDKPLMPTIPGMPDIAGAMGGALKGLFGR